MTDDRKTLVAAAVLAAAIGVYLEMSRHAAQRDGATKTAPAASVSAPASR